MNLLNNLRRSARCRQVHTSFPRGLRPRIAGTSASALLAVAAWILCAGPVALFAEEVKTEKEMKPYATMIHGTDVKYEMVPIPGGTFTMGSPASEKGRIEDEGPQRKVKIEPFWMGKHEVTWDEYDIWSFSLDSKLRKFRRKKATAADKLADAVTRPTPPYTDMKFGMGHDGFPAICMTQLAAKTYCKWLSEKTGHHYRLPTEAEWEYACRAGATTAYHFGDDPSKLGEYAWFADNSDDQYQKVGKKKPNPWGLHDMHGNVAEWVLDQYLPQYETKGAVNGLSQSPLAVATKLYPRVVRGGSWEDDPAECRSSSRRGSEEDWKFQDPQLPQSIWYHTDALFAGFRIIRPLRVPSKKERKELKLDAKKVVNKR